MRSTGTLTILLVVLLAIATVGVGGIGMMGPGVMGPGMMPGFATGTSVPTWMYPVAMVLGPIMMLAYLGAIVLGVILLVRWANGGSYRSGGPNETEVPLGILRRRYAAGEIDETTYERMKRELAA